MSESNEVGVFTPLSASGGGVVKIAMQRLWLVGRVTPAGARLLVRHTFRSGEINPLEVIYAFGLPRDAALRRFRIKGEGFSVKSELMPTDEAVEVYETGLDKGHTAALARQYGDGLVNLTVGNIRPGEEVTVDLEILAGVELRDDGFRFRFPFTLAPAYHARARAAEVRPGVGEIELPADEFGDLILPQFVSDAYALHQVGFDLTAAMPFPIVETASPSHAVRVVHSTANQSRISLATAKDVPNRDLVLDVKTKAGLKGMLSGTGLDGKGHFAALIPSDAFIDAVAGESRGPCRIVFLIDRSGSMGGAPIEQARRAVEACLGALGEKDGFGLVAFDDHVEAFGPGLFEATKGNRENAKAFLAAIDARGGTELAAGIQAASRMLNVDAEGQAGGDIFVVTDGQVMGTEKIIAAARADGIRLHCFGIGSASQDRFLAQLARETGGVSRFLTPRERVDLGAVELFASIGRPLATDLEASVEGFADGQVLPAPPKTVFAGAPVLLYGETPGTGDGRLALTWRANDGKRTAQIPFSIAAGGEGETLRLLRGARLITDLESRVSGTNEVRGPKAREAARTKRRLEELSKAYGLASTQMSLVAVVERAGDRPGDPPVTRVVSVGLAQDVEKDAYFACSPSFLASPAPRSPSYAFGTVRSCFGVDDSEKMQTVNRLNSSILKLKVERNDLLDLAADMDADGGMPGKNEEERVQATVLALLRFLGEGHSLADGAFRVHVRRLVEFLEKSSLFTEVTREIVALAKSGRSLPGDWSKRRLGPKLWKEICDALLSAQS